MIFANKINSFWQGLGEGYAFHACQISTNFSVFTWTTVVRPERSDLDKKQCSIQQYFQKETSPLQMVYGNCCYFPKTFKIFSK